jgi:UDPglucose 6-dehydrogenase/GDP-mannose 6-dehydrogenase
VKALIAHGKKLGARMPLMKAVIETNENQSDQVIRMLKKHFASLEKVRIAILGLSFKPDTDDMRESPAIPIIRKLLSQGALLKAYDPVTNQEARKLFPDHQLTLCESLEEALVDIDAAVLVTRWEQFGQVSELWSRLSPNAVFVDGRRMVDKNTITKYEGIGL